MFNMTLSLINLDWKYITDQNGESKQNYLKKRVSLTQIKNFCMTKINLYQSKKYVYSKML